MTAPVQTGIGGFLSRFERLRERLPGDPRQRLAAADAFRRAGLPGAAAGRREEAWKYTSLRPVADAEFQQSVTPLTSGSAVLERLPRIDAPRIVLVDGVFDPALSTLPASVTFTRFADQPAFVTIPRQNSEP